MKRFSLVTVYHLHVAHRHQHKKICDNVGWTVDGFRHSGPKTDNPTRLN